MSKILMSVVFIFLSLVVVNAQSATTAQPIITKGYYSIYKNADKLKPSGPLISISARDNEAAVIQPAKGYYSMNNHHRKIYKSGVSFIARKQKRPVASKGYYNMSLPMQEVVSNKKRNVDSIQSERADSAFVMIP